MLKEAETENTDERLSFHKRLEDCFLRLCKQLDIPIPLWMKKNTAEFSRYRKTFFPKDQFTEDVYFDVFEIKIEM